MSLLTRACVTLGLAVATLAGAEGLPSGPLEIIAGNGTIDFCGDGLPATQACLQVPQRVAYDRAGNLFILVFGRIRRVDAVTGVIETIAGSGTPDCLDRSDDPVPACDACVHATALAVDATGDVFFFDQSESCESRAVSRVRRIDAQTGMVSTYAGRWAYCATTPVEGMRATDACVDGDRLGFDRLVFDPEGNLHLTGVGRLLRVDRVSGSITTVAGNGQRDCGALNEGDGGPATAACIQPIDIDFDGAGNLFISERPRHSDVVMRVRRVDRTSGVITTVAGDASEACRSDLRVPDGGLATAGCLGGRGGAVAVDAAGRLYLSDEGRIRQVEATTGVISTLAGSLDPFSDAYLEVYDLAFRDGRLVFPETLGARYVLGLVVGCGAEECQPTSSATTPQGSLRACPPPEQRKCVKDRDCDDGDPCTYDRCTVGVCQSGLLFDVQGASCRAGQLVEATRCRGAGRPLVTKARKLRRLLHHAAEHGGLKLAQVERLFGKIRKASRRRADRGKLSPRCAPTIATGVNELEVAISRACPGH